MGLATPGEGYALEPISLFRVAPGAVVVVVMMPSAVEGFYGLQIQSSMRVELRRIDHIPSAVNHLNDGSLAVATRAFVVQVVREDGMLY
jgi:hypothetical protein